MQRPGCKARRVLDEFHCVECALRWDAGELEPPMCRDTTVTDPVDTVAQQHVEDHAPGWIRRALGRRFG